MSLYTYVYLEGRVKQERLALTVPGDLKRKARAQAIGDGTNLSELVRGWLAKYIAQETCMGCGQRFDREDMTQNALGDWYCGDCREA